MTKSVKPWVYTLFLFSDVLWRYYYVQTYNLAHPVCCTVFHSMQMPCFSNCPVSGNLYGFSPPPLPSLLLQTIV